MAYIWENSDWDNFIFDRNALEESYQRYIYQKGITDTILGFISPSTRSLVQADMLSKDIVSNSKIEGIDISYDSVYSSVAKALDIDVGIKVVKDKNIESITKIAFYIIEDNIEISEDTLLAWHKLLFDGVPLANRPKDIGSYRETPIYVMNTKSSMSEDVLYEGVPVSEIQNNMTHLFNWINKHDEVPPIIKSAVASLWLVSIHPFEDGNGRLSRILSDAILLKDEKYKYCTISSAILKQRKEYYQEIYKAQHSDSMDITGYISWYIDMVTNALKDVEKVCREKIRLSEFMISLDPSEYNSREISMLYKLASGSFYGKLTAEKWSKLTKCKSATATRDLAHLVERGLLVKSDEGGRASWYSLNRNLNHN